VIVDTHAHIYSADEAAYPPIEQPYRPPDGTGTPERLRERMRAAGVDRAMLIQTSTFYGWDNSFVRDTSAGAGDWAVGVCTLNPDDPHSPDVLYAMVERSNVRALRTYVAREGAYRGRFDTPGNRRLFGAARDLGIVVNALLSRPATDGLSRLLEAFPDLPVVLDHCLALQVGPDEEATVERVVDLARYPNLHAKLTFLPTGSAEEYPFRDLHGACRRILDAYGPGRCVWGSDFPTELWCPKTTCAGHLDLFRHELGLSPDEQAAVLGETATRLYRLPPRL
jgi:predicted TIM-barrel fold metal-dependent hydrolase